MSGEDERVHGCRLEVSLAGTTHFPAVTKHTTSGTDLALAFSSSSGSCQTNETMTREYLDGTVEAAILNNANEPRSRHGLSDLGEPAFCSFSNGTTRK